MEEIMKRNQFMMKPFFTLMNHHPGKPNLFIKCKRVGSGEVPMAIVFRTFLICQAVSVFSWLAPRQLLIRRQLRPQSPVQRLPEQGVPCARRPKCCLIYSMHWLFLWQKLI